jgi:actin-related protein 5
MDVDQSEVVILPSPTPIGQPGAPEDYTSHRDRGTPLVIDNGATSVRFGFATSDAPRTGLNTVAKYKERKTNRPMLLFGDAVESESAAKPQIRTPWEGDVLLNFDALVCAAVVHAVALLRKRRGVGTRPGLRLCSAGDRC